MELFLVLSNAYFVGGPQMFAYHISIVLNICGAHLALVLFDDIAGVDREVFHRPAMPAPPMLIEGIFVRKESIFALGILRTVELTAFVPRVRGGLSKRGGRLPL